MGQETVAPIPLSRRQRSPDALKKRVAVTIDKYMSRREAKNSSRNAKPLFTNIEKEKRDLETRKRVFQTAIDKAEERLGDMSVFQKYQKTKKARNVQELLVEVRPFSTVVIKTPVVLERLNQKKVNRKQLSLGTSLVLENSTVTSVHQRRRSQPFSDLPQTTKSGMYTPKEKSTPMHLDPQYRFPLKSAFTETADPVLQLSLQADGVVSQCEALKEISMASKRDQGISARSDLRHTKRGLSSVSDMLESLRTCEEDFPFEANMRRRKAIKDIDRRILATAGDVKKSYMATSEYVAKYAHKGIWRFSTHSMAIHTDKLINSLPINKGIFK